MGRRRADVHRSLDTLVEHSLIDQYEPGESPCRMPRGGYFFHSHTKIPELMREVGSTGPPQISFHQALSSPDEF